MTLLEVLVSLGVLAMISLLIYGAFDSLSRGRKGEALRVDRARQGRDAMDRITHEMQAAFLSMHNPANLSLVEELLDHILESGYAPMQMMEHAARERDLKQSLVLTAGSFQLKRAYREEGQR